MNHVLSLVQAARRSSDPRPGLRSGRMLVELLALHEEMIEQLRLERLAGADNAGFLAGMIEQHEKTAAMLRTKLENPAAYFTPALADRSWAVAHRFSSAQ